MKNKAWQIFEVGADDGEFFDNVLGYHDLYVGIERDDYSIGRVEHVARIFHSREYARLIASAPELLEALKTMVRRVERDNLHTTKGWDLTRAKEAIARAEGE